MFHIHGELCQVVHIVLQPNQKIQCEPGSMCYSSNDCQAEVKLGGIGRLITEGDIFKSIYHNKANSVGFVGLTGNFPSSIIPLNLDAMGGSILCKITIDIDTFDICNDHIHIIHYRQTRRLFGFY